jgi:alcohol dehydrogenase (cytochrome c)
LRVRSVAVVIVVLLSALGVVGATQIPGVAWRLQVLSMKSAGKLSDLGWGELLTMIAPGSPYYLQPLTANPNPFAIITNPYTTAEDLRHGSNVYRVHCGGCHGLDGQGGHGPDLVNGHLKTGDSEWAMFRTTQRGIPGTAMAPVALEDRERWQVIGHLKELRRARANAGSLGQHNIAIRTSVSTDNLENAANDPRNWLTYSGNYNSWRFSALNQITSKNVSAMTLAWTLQVNTSEYIETSPVVVDGVMFLSEPPSNVRAVDASSGQTLWTYQRDVPADVAACCGRVNRGVAVLDGQVFIGTLDAHLVALDAQTGAVAWDVEVAPYSKGFSITAAPLAARGKIIVGVSGGEYGIRGFLDAYDATSGERAWRFYTIPSPEEFGGDTWRGDAWKKGGGPTWLTGSFDPGLSQLYWGVGNPSPDFDGTVRPGDNLFTNSVVALNIETGARVWHFQFTPHDEHDWDSNQIPVLIDREVGGSVRPLMLWANRNGFYYVLDRSNGRLVNSRPFAKQNWAKELDANGRPVPSESAAPSETGTLTWPGEFGATNWWSPSYSPATDLFYVPFIHLPAIFVRGVDHKTRNDGEEFKGGATIYTDPTQTGVRALSPLSGELVWEYDMPSRMSIRQIGGILTTAGNLLFTGNAETFYALDATNGARLWSINLGGRIKAAPITFETAGRQMVVIAAGHSIFAFAAASGQH